MSTKQTSKEEDDKLKRLPQICVTLEHEPGTPKEVIEKIDKPFNSKCLMESQEHFEQWKTFSSEEKIELLNHRFKLCTEMNVALTNRVNSLTKELDVVRHGCLVSQIGIMFLLKEIDPKVVFEKNLSKKLSTLFLVAEESQSFEDLNDVLIKLGYYQKENVDTVDDPKEETKDDLGASQV